MSQPIERDASAHPVRRRTGAVDRAGDAMRPVGRWDVRRRVDQIEDVQIVEAEERGSSKAVRLALTASAASAAQIRRCLAEAAEPAEADGDDSVPETCDGRDDEAGWYWVCLPLPSGKPLVELIEGLGPPPAVVARDWQRQLKGAAMKTRLQPGTERYWSAERLTVDAENRLGLRDPAVIAAVVRLAEEENLVEERDGRDQENRSGECEEDALSSGAIIGGVPGPAIAEDARAPRRRKQQSRYIVSGLAMTALLALIVALVPRPTEPARTSVAQGGESRAEADQATALAMPTTAREAPLSLERLDPDVVDLTVPTTTTEAGSADAAVVDVDSLLVDPGALLASPADAAGAADSTAAPGDAVPSMPSRTSQWNPITERVDGESPAVTRATATDATPSRAEGVAEGAVETQAGEPIDLRRGRAEVVLDLGAVPHRRSELRIGYAPPAGIRLLNPEQQVDRLRSARFHFWLVSDEEADEEASDAGEQPQYGVLVRIDASGGRRLELRTAVFVQLDPLTAPLAWHQDAAALWGDRIAAQIAAAESMQQTLRARGRAADDFAMRSRLRQQQDLVEQQVERLRQTGRRLASVARMIERMSREGHWELAVESSQGAPLRWMLGAAVEVEQEDR